MYKVVRVSEDGRLYSAAVEDRQYKTEYLRGTWSEPSVKGTPVFVYDTLERAVEFMYEEGYIMWNNDSEEWESEHDVYFGLVENPKLISEIAVVLESGSMGSIWGGSHDELTTEAGVGVYGADRIFLLAPIAWMVVFNELMEAGVLTRGDASN